MLVDELEASWLYDRLADFARNDGEAETLRELAESERDHARHWAERIDGLALLEGPLRPSWRPRALALIARFAGVGAV